MFYLFSEEARSLEVCIRTRFKSTFPVSALSGTYPFRYLDKDTVASIVAI